ncbi:Uncharacterised protein [Legionella bozemanae]|uniref:Uncharacterized protein n=1 Tax=Legionella bozemanae TaxID=447 RepID=A0A0W0R6I3_LEGBO|nr:hypothetical protein Lboz_3570 [Legionella bozemanae]STO33536.1 Uncharacterised protein [Legionella bozemanae]
MIKILNMFLIGLFMSISSIALAYNGYHHGHYKHHKYYKHHHWYYPVKYHHHHHKYKHKYPYKYHKHPHHHGYHYTW